MIRVAYLSNRFPSAVEPYVGAEIDELRRQGLEVVPCSVWRGDASAEDVLPVVPWNPVAALRAVGLLIRNRELVEPILSRARRGRESIGCKLRALAHTLLGSCLALALRERDVQHIHVHHGYFSCWIAMVAARLLGITYSVTLHGSDLLLGAPSLDVKLEHCLACFTVSEYNRDFLLRTFPQIPEDKVFLRRLGVAIPSSSGEAREHSQEEPLELLAVGRLHAVKDHAFLVHACSLLKKRNVRFRCAIAGEGPERRHLERLISTVGLESEVRLLGHIHHPVLNEMYRSADLLVLTSKSEGLPLTLMEAMAVGTCVLAPEITGIPELVADGQTGFLYAPGDLEDFVEKVELIHRTRAGLSRLRGTARQFVERNFNRERNLESFAGTFIQLLSTAKEQRHASPVLQ